MGERINGFVITVPDGKNRGAHKFDAKEDANSALIEFKKESKYPHAVHLWNAIISLGTANGWSWSSV